jgi:D-lactate dehydrogenase (cytochrome)
MYRAGLRAGGFEAVIFGHAGNSHLHVNILPRTFAEYEAGRALYGEWAGEVVAMGGTVSAEHGIGKLKTGLLRDMMGAEAVRQMRALKRTFDPAGLLGRGTLFAPEDDA